MAQKRSYSSQHKTRESGNHAPSATGPQPFILICPNWLLIICGGSAGWRSPDFHQLAPISGIQMDSSGKPWTKTLEVETKGQRKGVCNSSLSFPSWTRKNIISSGLWVCHYIVSHTEVFFFLSKQSSTNTVKLSELKDQNTWSVDTLSMNENGWDILWGLLHGFLLFGPSPHGRLFVIWIKALPGPGSSQRNQWPPYLHQLLLLKKEQSMWLPWMSVHSFRAPNFKTDSMKNLQKNLNRGFLRTFHNKSTPTRLGDIVLCPRLGTYSKRHGGLLAFCPWLHSNSFCRQYPGTRMQIQ